MSQQYRLWYVRRGEKVQGPFPEPLVCRFLAIGRIADQDALSLDREYWRNPGQIPELNRQAQAMIEGAIDEYVDDPEWAEERAKAALRWLDDRKSPDPRTLKPQKQADLERRSGQERRQSDETSEQQAYRQWRGLYEVWLRSGDQRYGILIAILAAIVLGVIVIAMLFQPVNPIKIKLQMAVANCMAPAAKGVNWNGCDKAQGILVGADLRSAELVGTSFRGANLSYADLSGANLLDADLSGANLAGARLSQAVWADGRLCSDDSVGRCQ